MSKGKAFEVGIFGDKYPAYINNVPLREYSLWYSLIRRCHSKVYQKDKPTYIGCEVSDNFKSYTYFYEWCQDQIGYTEQGWHLDKDILVKGNKLYSEHACVFVPADVNALFTLSGRARGNYPLGVSLKRETGKFQAACTVGKKSKIHLGCHDTPEAAFSAYKEFKEMAVKDAAKRFQGRLDDRVYKALMNYEVEITD